MYEHLKRNLGLRLKTIRQQQGKTQQQLADAIEKSFETISNIERGRTAPGFATLAEISQVLGVPMREFFEPEDSETTEERQRLMVQVNALIALMDDRKLEILLKMGMVLQEGEDPADDS